MNETMNDPEDNPAVPDQKTGTRTGAEHRRKFESDAEALYFFKEAKARYMDINRWGNLAGELGADFRLCDEKGNEVQREPRIGDHIKIDLPGPGPEAGGYNDWVRIEEIHGIEESEVREEIDEYFALVTRPSTDPRTNLQTVAHFYDDRTTSTFVLQREFA